MTRFTPQGPPSGGRYLGADGQYQQPQYGEGQASYGNYASNDGQVYGQQPQYQQQSVYGNEAQGNAQSYYGSNDQAYQQYPNESYSGQQYQAGSPPGASHVQPHIQHYEQPYIHPVPMYGNAPPAAGHQAEYPPYGQSYQEGGDVAAFKSHFEQPYGPMDPSAPVPPPGPPSAQDQRGLMGAMGGAAVGGYGGHKMGHGLLGALGGAAAGSIAEDMLKKQRKEQKHKRRDSSASSCSDEGKHHGGGGMVNAGNFRASSKDVRLEHDHMLVAECADTHGHHQWSSLDLNDCFTNDGGRLKWARGGNFAASSRHFRLIDDGNGLEVECGNGHGGWDHNKIWLPEKITNENGRLQMID